MRSDELFPDFAHIGPPSSVEIAQEDWDEDEWMKIGALKRDSALNIGGIDQEIAEVFSGQAEYAWARAIHKQKISVDVDVIEHTGHTRALALQQALDDWRLTNPGASEYVKLAFGHPRKVKRFALRITVPLWDSPDRPVSHSKAAVWYLNKARIVGPVGQTYNAENFTVTTYRFEGEGKLENDDEIGDLRVHTIDGSVEGTVLASPTPTTKSFAANEFKDLGDNDFCVGWWCQSMDDTNLTSDPTKVVKSYVKLSGLITVYGNWPQAPAATKKMRLFQVP